MTDKQTTLQSVRYAVHCTLTLTTQDATMSYEDLIKIIDRAVAYIEQPSLYSDAERAELLNDMSASVDEFHDTTHWQ